jgi:CHAT domain-containing protein
LVSGRPERAVAELSRAAAMEPQRATLWSDLAAARLEQAAATADSFELVLALVAADRALERDAGLLPARHNRALALADLSLRAQAAAEWRSVLALEVDPAWRRQAEAYALELARGGQLRDWEADLQTVTACLRAHREVPQPLLRSAQQRLREHVEEVLLPRWAAAEQAGRLAEAEDALFLARAASGLLAARGERMAADTIAEIDRLQAAGQGGLQGLAAGMVIYGNGLTLERQGKFSRAAPVFAAARSRFAGRGSPFARWAALQSAVCLYQVSDYRRAVSLLQRLLRDPALVRYPALEGRALWMLGLIEELLGRPTASIDHFATATKAFRAIGETANAARTSALEATDLATLGRQAEAWRRIHPALLDSLTLRPDARFRICELASLLAQEQNETATALWFQDEVVRTGQTVVAPELVIGALRGRAELLAAAGRDSAAAADLAQAQGYLDRVSDPATRLGIRGDLLLAAGELAASRAPREAIASLDAAIKVLRQTSYHFQLGRALYRRAVVENAIGRTDEAERDLVAAIKDLERQRESIASPEDRVSYLDRKREIFDTLIELQLDRGQDGAALGTSERARSRVLRDWVLAEVGGSLGEFQAAGAAAEAALDLRLGDLPANTAVVEYLVLPDRVVAWLLRRSQPMRRITVQIRQAMLEALVIDFRRALLGGREVEAGAAAERLFGLLVEPLAAVLVPGDRLVFVPDGILHTLPFAALRDPRRHRFLIEEYACSVAPSASVLIASYRRDRRLARGPRPPRALVAAAPGFDRARYPALVPLTASGTGPSVLRLFPGSLVLRGREATRKTFLRLGRDYEILDFGGHSLINVGHPLLSAMLFAPDSSDADDGVLSSSELLHCRFPRARLAVLASCETGVGKLSRTEGVENLARSFLASGVPVVVASLWPVDDQLTDAFFVEFYGALRRHFDVAGALQVAQVKSLLGRGGPAAQARVWGAFEAVGYGGVVAPPGTKAQSGDHPLQ